MLDCGSEGGSSILLSHPNLIVMEEDKIEELEGEIVELKFQLQKSKNKEMIYLDILSNIDTSLKILFKREQENERFNLDDEVDYRECVVNLKSSLDEYKRVYKLRLWKCVVPLRKENWSELDVKHHNKV